MAQETWFYCLKHHQVEPYEACKAIDRLGPYDSPEEAELALERVAWRNEDWEHGALSDRDE